MYLYEYMHDFLFISERWAEADRLFAPKLARPTNNSTLAQSQLDLSGYGACFFTLWFPSVFIFSLQVPKPVYIEIKICT
jgi:hypothetical protein